MVDSEAKICVLVAHEPALDPRVAWVHSTLEKFAEVRTINTNASSRGSKMFLLKEIFELGSCVGVRSSVRIIFWLSVGVCVEFLPVLLWMIITAGFKLVKLLNRRVGEQMQTKLQALKNISGLRPARMLIFCSRARAIFEAASFIRRDDLEKNWSFVYCHDFETLWAGYVASEFNLSRLIFDAHEFYSFADVESRFWEVYFWLVLERALTSKLEAKFTVSPTLASVMQRSLGGQWQTVCNAIPLNAGLSNTAFKTGRKVRYVFLGRYAPGRGLEEMVDYFLDDRIVNASLAIRAPDSNGLAALKRFVAVRDSEFKKVNFLPAVSEIDLVSSLRDFDVGVIPYLPIGPNNTHCCPNKLSQYVGAGLGVLSNDLEFVNSFIESHNCGRSFSDRESFVQAVRSINVPGTLERCRSNAARAFQLEFNWEIQSKPLEAILKVRLK